MINLKHIINFLEDNSNISLNSDELHDLIKNYNSDDWEKYQKFDIHNYKKNLVFRNDNFEIFVVCWSGKQGSHIHDHSENGCILKILKGRLTEYKYNVNNLDLNELSYLPEQTISYIDNSIGYHKIINDTLMDTVSLHIYSPPNYQGKIYYVDT